MLFSEIFWLHAAMVGGKLVFFIFVFFIYIFCFLVTVCHRDVGGGGILDMYV